MPRVETYGPQVGQVGNISSGAISTIANMPTTGDMLNSAFKPVAEYLQKTNDQRVQTDTLSKMSEFEIRSRQRLQQLQETDLGDQNISEVYTKEMTEGFEQLSSSINPAARDFFGAHSIALKESIANQALNAQAAQNAVRVKNSAETFTSNMQKMAITDPQNVQRYADQINTFADTLAVSAEAKDAYRRSAMDSVYDAQATSLKETNPEGFWNLYKSGFYNDKVTPDTLAKMQTYRAEAEQVVVSRAQVAASQATTAGELQSVINSVEGSQVLDEQSKNNMLTSLYNTQKGMMADVFKARKNYETGMNIINGAAPYDETDTQQREAINQVYTARRAALISSYGPTPTDSDEAKSYKNQQANEAISRLNLSFVRDYNILPGAAVAEIGRKLGNYSNPASVNEGMTEISILAKQAPVVLSKLPKEMTDDYNTFQMLADKYGYDGGEAAKRMIEIKRMTMDDRKADEELRTQADLGAEEAYKRMNSGIGPAPVLRTSGIVLGTEGSWTRSLFDWNIGAAARGLDYAANFVTRDRDNLTSALLFQDSSSPDVGWLKTRWQQHYRRGFIGTKGTDPELAARHANLKVQEEFGSSGITRGNSSATFDVMWMPPEKVLEMRGVKSVSLGLRQGGEWDELVKTMENEMRYVQEPLVNIGGAPMLDENGKPKMQTIDLWQRTGMKPDMSINDIRLTTTPIDKQTKTAEDFSSNPVYGMEFLGADNMWHQMTNGKGQPIFMDFNRVIDKVKKYKESK